MGDAPPDSPYGSAARPQPAEPTPGQASEPSLTAVPDAVAAIARATRDQLIGTTVLGYVVKGKIGSGGMGIVYEGEQPTIGKRVAIKVLRPEMADKPGQVEALAAEARAVNRVGHRGIVDVFGFGVLPDGRQAIIMELLEGESLKDIISKNKHDNHIMPVGEVMLILEEVLSALDAAHGAGVIHRDIKPSNIFLCTQRGGSRFVKLLDFGIAKLEDAGAKPKTNPSMIMGTPAYMAPEQAFRGKVTPAADLYAVGIIAFELLTNRLPFESGNVVELLYAHAEKAPPRPSEILMSIPDEVDDLVLSLLQKKPEDRPQDGNKVRMLVKRARKLLLHSTAHPELKLSRDKATGKLILEERASSEQPLLLSGAPAPAPAPKPKGTISSPKLQLARTKSVGAAPAVRPSKKFEPLEPGEVTVPQDSKARVIDDQAGEATIVPGRFKPPDVTFVPGRLQPATVKNVPVEPGAPAAAGGSLLKPLLVVGVALVLGLAALVWTQRARFTRSSGPAVIEIIEVKSALAPAVLEAASDGGL
jgi:serine/threonine-protein kinase